MSAMAALSAVDRAVIERDTRDSAEGMARTRRRRLSGAIRLILLGVLTLIGVSVGPRGVTDRQNLPLAVPDTLGAPTDAPVLPGTPTEDVLTLVIPSGAAADQGRGGRGYTMPSVIQLTTGDKIVLRNDDSVPHTILYAFLLPGQTHERTFMTPGSEVYSAGCGVHGASILNFTTIFVSEAGR